MIGKRTLLWTCLLAAVAVPPALGQEKPDEALRRRRQEQVTRIVQLAHQNAYHLATTIDKLHLPVSAVGSAGNRLLVSGSAQDVQRLIDEFVPLVDVPTSGAGGNMVTEFIPIRYCQTGTLLPLLRTVAPDPVTEIALDGINRMLVVRAKESEIKAIRELLRQVDRPSHAITLHFYFLRAHIGRAKVDVDEKVAGKVVLPPALEPIAATLMENGFENPSLIAPIIVVVDQGRDFNSESLLRPTDDRGVAEDELNIVVRGDAQLQANQDYFQLNLHAFLQGSYPNPEGEGQTPSGFEIQTSIVGKLGEYVILAASPSSTANGDAVALAVRATRN